MQSEFRLLKYVDGICHFARVAVDVKPIESGVCVIEAIREPIAEGDGEVNHLIASRWLDAALKGAKHCASILVSQSKTSGCHVEINRVVGVHVDTTEQDVFCAGAIATWQALNPNAELPAFYFVEGEWLIKF